MKCLHAYSSHDMNPKLQAHAMDFSGNFSKTFPISRRGPSCRVGNHPPPFINYIISVRVNVGSMDLLSVPKVVYDYILPFSCNKQVKHTGRLTKREDMRCKLLLVRPHIHICVTSRQQLQNFAKTLPRRQSNRKNRRNSTLLVECWHAPRTFYWNSQMSG